jgi:hypothetical protein
MRNRGLAGTVLAVGVLVLEGMDLLLGGADKVLKPVVPAEEPEPRTA